MDEVFGTHKVCDPPAGTFSGWPLPADICLIFR
jgi:hypothetical protein